MPVFNPPFEMMKEKRTLSYGKQYVDAADVQSVTQALKREMITRGKKVEEFEEAFAKRCNATYAVAFNSGSAALKGAYFAAETSSFDKVITTPNTFVATVGAACQYGAVPVFVDIDRKSGNFDLEKVALTINGDRTRGKEVITPVHFSGIPVDMQALQSLIKKEETVVIEDAAHALGSCYADGTSVGSCRYSDLTIFSFHPVKMITTGEGGMVTTNSEKLAHRLTLYRNNCIESDPNLWEGEAKPWHYEVVGLSGNFHLTDFQAALGLSQLKKLSKFVEKRRKLVARYRTLLKDKEGIELFSEVSDSLAGFHLFVTQIDFEKFGKSREKVIQQLKKAQVGSQVHYIPLYHHPYFRKICGEISSCFPEMETYFSQALTLPLFYDMRLSEVDRTVDALFTALGIKNPPSHLK